MIMETHARNRGQAALGGVVAGIAGGLAITLVMLIAAAAGGRDIWMTFKFAAAPLLGDRAMLPGFDAGAVLLGTVCHLAVSIVWGVLFALLAYGLSRGATVIAGAVFGIVVWIGMFYVVMPIVGLGRGGESQPVAFAILEHVVFGVVTGIAFLPFQRYRPGLVAGRVGAR
jgi:hypothetical protein